MRSHFISAAAILFAVSAHAGDLRQPILDQLAGVESPPTAAALRAVGAHDAVRDELLALSKDDTLPRSQRLRALHALGWFPSDASRAALTAALEGSDRHAARKAAYALANGWQAAALPELAGALGSDDVQVRIAAAKALGGIGTPEARAALETRLPAETSDTVRSEITQSLATSN